MGVLSESGLGVGLSRGGSSPSPGAAACGVSVGFRLIVAVGVSVAGTAACSVAAQLGVGVALPSGAMKAKKPCEGRLQLINTRTIKKTGVYFFMSALDQTVRIWKFFGNNRLAIFGEVAIVQVTCTAGNPAI